MPVLSFNLKKLILSLLPPIIVGAVAAFAVQSGLDEYLATPQPLLAPPPAVFAVVWTVLYLMMGTSAYILSASDGRRRDKEIALRLYYAQLAVNLIWPVVFFGLGLYATAVFVIVTLWVLVLLCVIAFLRVSRTAAFLLIPYLIWIAFATYLNIGTAVLTA